MESGSQRIWVTANLGHSELREARHGLFKVTRTSADSIRLGDYFTAIRALLACGVLCLRECRFMGSCMLNCIIRAKSDRFDSFSCRRGSRNEFCGFCHGAQATCHSSVRCSDAQVQTSQRRQNGRQTTVETCTRGHGCGVC